ncbi:SURF1 family protein [Streptomyces sp. ITFR-6]|uniref:SURF1 family protein n=1 Tax=Streptomyces sp. ITFR-6 TaxID=3075197 RepID=UPI00288BC271|nr:SURF1 family protein [Streptomyces sp. ITFR-6]WNI30886.1 SURF1 family protein [Streptomyces sp. ITFR-6]
MYRFLLTPRWWGINLFVVLAIPFCVFMGTWQLGRFEDRVQTHEAAEKQPAPGTRAAKPIDELLPVDTVTSGRPATATGRYADQFLVPGRKLDDRTGFYVVGMLRTDSGKALPVVRGWLPGKAGHTSVPPAPTGDVTVTGDLQASESTGTAGVDATGGLPDGQVGMISAASLVNLVPYDVYDAWVTLQRSDVRTGGAETAGKGEKGTGAATALRPVPAAAAQGTGLDLKAFQNLGYLCEWFVFAAFVLFMWFRLVRREAEAVRDVRLGLVVDPAAVDPDTTDPDTADPDTGASGPEAAPDREAGTHVVL